MKRKKLNLFKIMLGVILFSLAVYACSPIEDEMLDCPTCQDDETGNGNGNTGNGNGNGVDTVFVYSTKTNLKIDTITNINFTTVQFETNDPNAVAYQDTVTTEKSEDSIVENIEERFVEPDSMYVTTIQDIFRTLYINHEVTIHEPVIINPPVEGADSTIYLEMSIFTHLYGQVEKDGSKYLNFYGGQKGAHVKKSDFTVFNYKSGILSREAAISEAESHNYSGVAENLYFDHVQSIWIWVFNKEASSFMVEANNGISWSATPSSKDRFFSVDYEIREGGQQLWITYSDGRIICFVAKDYSPS